MKPFLILFTIVVSCLATASEKATHGPPIHYVVFHKPGPAWVKGVSFKQQSGVQDHIAHYAKALKEGKLYAGGPFLDESGGGMMISSEGVTESWIKKFAAEDPAVKSGLLTFDIRPWLIGLEKGP